MARRMVVKAPAEWTMLRDRYTETDSELSALRASILSRMAPGTSMREALGYVKAPERNRYNALEARRDKIQAAQVDWLLAHSPWYWESGVSCAWISASLTYEQAVSETCPVLPAESISFGSTAPAILMRRTRP